MKTKHFDNGSPTAQYAFVNRRKLVSLYGVVWYDNLRAAEQAARRFRIMYAGQQTKIVFNNAALIECARQSFHPSVTLTVI